MKKTLLGAVLLFILSGSLSSCRETEKRPHDKVIIIEKEENKVPVKRDGALEKAGRAIDNAAKEVKEAGKSVDSAAKEIVGDDN